MEYTLKREMSLAQARTQKSHLVVLNPNLLDLSLLLMTRLSKNLQCPRDLHQPRIASKNAFHIHHFGKSSAVVLEIVSVSCSDLMLVFLLDLIRLLCAKYGLSAIHVGKVTRLDLSCTCARGRIPSADPRFLGRGMLH